MSAAVERSAPTDRGVKARDTKRPGAPVVVALGGEHQPAVPVAQRSVGDSHQVEQRETDALQPRIVRQRLHVVLAENDLGTRYLVGGQRSLPRRLAQHFVQVCAERAGQID